MVIKKCKICKKELLKKQKRCCSRKCEHIYRKKHKKGFFNLESQSKGGHNAQKTLKQLNKSCYDLEEQSRRGKIGGKNTHKLHPNLAKENAVKGHETNKKNKTSFWSSTVQSELSKRGASKAGKIGGPRGIEANRKNSPYIWKSVNFMSKMEILFAMWLLKEPIDGVNCNIKVGSKTIDFFPQSYDNFFKNKFVEFHPWDRQGLSDEQYYNQRRQALDENNYKKYELVVIK